MGLQGYVDRNSTSEVTAAGTMTDERLIRGAGGKGLQDSGVTLDDSDNMTGVNSITLDVDLTVPNGGTGASTFTDNALLRGQLTDPLSPSTVKVSDNGEMTNTSQPSFNAYVTPDITDVTGDGTVYTIIFSTTLYDQNSDFNTTTGTFTAPVAGKYYLHINLSLAQLTTSFTTCTVNIVAGGQTSTIFSGNPGAMMNAANVLTISGGQHINMGAAAEATVTVAVSGSTKTIDVKQFFTLGTNFSGFLVC